MKERARLYKTAAFFSTKATTSRIAQLQVITNSRPLNFTDYTSVPRSLPFDSCNKFSSCNICKSFNMQRIREGCRSYVAKAEGCEFDGLVVVNAVKVLLFPCNKRSGEYQHFLYCGFAMLRCNSDLRLSSSLLLSLLRNFEFDFLVSIIP